MPGPYQGWAYLRDQTGQPREIFNHARTAAYLANPDLAIAGISICDILEFGGCQGYAYEPWCEVEVEDPTATIPTLDTESGVPSDFESDVDIEAEGIPPPQGEWEPYVFITPAADGAPWYNANYPESADALGFFVEEWTGLDNRHVQRKVAARPFGGQLGALGASERVMKMNVIAFARSERAMEYQFRWLEATLSTVCSTCETSSMWIRRWCPTDLEALWDGIAELRDVGLIEGLSWESDLMDISRCFIRRMSFTLAAGDPCMYSPGVDSAEAPSATANLAACLNDITTDANASRCRPTCNELSSQCRTVYTYDVDPMGAMAPIVTLTNNDDEFSAPVRVIAYADPMGVGVDPNPCGLHALGEIYVSLLPPWSELIWDVAGRTIRYRDGTTGDEVGGWAFVGGNDPPIPRYFTMPCGEVHIVMELASRCLQLDGVTWYSGATPLGSVPHYPTVSVTLVERHGCP